MSKNRSTSRIIRLLIERGWTYIRDTGKNHCLYRCPCGHHQVAAPKHGDDKFDSASPIVKRINSCPGGSK